MRLQGYRRSVLDEQHKGSYARPTTHMPNDAMFSSTPDDRPDPKREEDPPLVCPKHARGASEEDIAACADCEALIDGFADEVVQACEESLEGEPSVRLAWASNREERS